MLSKIQLPILFSLLMSIWSSCHKEPNCNSCDTLLISAFSINDEQSDYFITYDEQGKISSIRVEQGIDDTKQIVDFNFAYSGGQLVSSIEMHSLINNASNAFAGTVKKKFLSVVLNDEVKKVYEIVDEIVQTNTVDYELSDTIVYWYTLDDTGEYRLRDWFDYNSQTYTGYQYGEDAVNPSLKEFDDLNTAPGGGVQFYSPYDFDKNINSLKLLNDNLGYAFFKSVEFISYNCYRAATIFGPTRPGQGPDISYGNEIILDCYDNVIGIGDIVIHEKYCK